MHTKIRRQIAWHAARLIYTRRETDLVRARTAAAREIIRGWVPDADMPNLQEIREQLDRFTISAGGETWGGGELLSDEPVELDRYQLFQSLLYPLENVMQHRVRHPEGDALYHSLQVFDLARDKIPYDEEFLLAALLHDVGKALDRQDHVAAGLQALAETITERTHWFIEHHSAAHACLDGTIGARARRRLEQDESFEELLLLARCDRQGRQRGVTVPTVPEALAYIRELDGDFDDFSK